MVSSLGIESLFAKVMSTKPEMPKDLPGYKGYPARAEIAMSDFSEKPPP
jgi:hypothetical protein